MTRLQRGIRVWRGGDTGQVTGDGRFVWRDPAPEGWARRQEPPRARTSTPPGGAARRWAGAAAAAPFPGWLRGARGGPACSRRHRARASAAPRAPRPPPPGRPRPAPAPLRPSPAARRRRPPARRAPPRRPPAPAPRPPPPPAAAAARRRHARPGRRQPGAGVRGGEQPEEPRVLGLRGARPELGVKRRAGTRPPCRGRASARGEGS